MERIVVVLCGPAGAGKTTAAHQSGLIVYDRDDPEWTGEKHFKQRIAELAHDPYAQAVVIRQGATSTARAAARALVGATHIYLLEAPIAELKRRIAHRDRADKIHGIASLNRWVECFDRNDGVENFPGWGSISSTPTDPLGVTSRTW
jgi:shikimate kinase